MLRRMNIPLHALRAFAAAARHLSFTRAAEELYLSQPAISQQVKQLEERLGVALFRRLPRGLVLTDEGAALLPVVNDSFARLAGTLNHLQGGRPSEVLNLGVVNSFAVGWLLPRLANFQRTHPQIDLRLFTHNNAVDLLGEGLDMAIRFGSGHWHGTAATELLHAPLTPMCSPQLALSLKQPADLLQQPLLRSYRQDEWPRWFDAAGLPAPMIRGLVFDTSLAMAEAAAQGLGVALLPALLFQRDLSQGRLVQLFPIALHGGSYWLTWLQGRPVSRAMLEFQQWLGNSSRAGGLQP